MSQVAPRTITVHYRSNSIRVNVLPACTFNMVAEEAIHTNARLLPKKWRNLIPSISCHHGTSMNWSDHVPQHADDIYILDRVH